MIKGVKDDLHPSISEKLVFQQTCGQDQTNKDIHPFVVVFSVWPRFRV